MSSMKITTDFGLAYFPCQTGQDASKILTEIQTSLYTSNNIVKKNTLGKLP